MHWLRLTVFGVATLSVALPTFAQEVPGVRVGEKAPAFQLKDQNGQTVSLEKLLEQGPVALVFYRSADW